MMEMGLLEAEFSTISMKCKLVELVQLHRKLWDLLKMASKSYLRDSIKIKINIGRKLLRTAIK
jgi:hypothetical protein